MRKSIARALVCIMVAIVLVACGGGGGGGSTATTTPAKPTNVLSFYGDPAVNDVGYVWGKAVPNATSYKLYGSTDGATNWLEITNFTYTLTPGVSPSALSQLYGWGFHSPANAYYRTTAFVGGVESYPSTPVYLSYDNRNTMQYITASGVSNGATGVSVTPTFTWTSYPGADAYFVFLAERNNGNTQILGKTTSTSLSVGAPNLSVVFEDSISPALKHNKQYHFIVMAISASGEQIAISNNIEFTTTP